MLFNGCLIINEDNLGPFRQLKWAVGAPHLPSKTIPLICHLRWTLTQLKRASKQVKQSCPPLWRCDDSLYPVSLMAHELFSWPVCLLWGPTRTAARLHRRDELMNSELDRVKLGMTPWSVPVIRLVAKLEVDGFIGLWLSAALAIRRRRVTSVTFVQIFVCRHSFLLTCLRL